jgi:hypothetical protein
MKKRASITSFYGNLYIFNKKVVKISCLIKKQSFGKEIIPQAVGHKKKY